MNEIPVKEVIELKEKGLNQDKIIDELLSQKYSYQQIRDAITQANIKKTVTNPSNNVNETIKPTTPTTPKVETQQPQTITQPKPTTHNNLDIDSIQRIMEEIIDEKWKQSEQVINSLIEWKGVITNKLKEMDNKFSEFNTRLNTMNTIVGKKNEEFNKTMQNVDTEMQALEKALNKLIPTLSDNISELKEIINKK